MSVNEPNRRISKDHPKYSRLFISYGGNNYTEPELRDAFAKFGIIEEIRIPKNHNTGEPKGVAYIKFSKTSEAAAALEEMHNKYVGRSSRPIRVMVANDRSSINSNEHFDNETAKRVFITVPRNATELELEEYFTQFGDVHTVLLQRDRNTGDSKGFAYVTYKSFLGAACATEDADRKYRVVFAAPKNTNKRSNTAFESNINILAAPTDDGLLSMMNVAPAGYTRVCAMCSPFVHKFYIEKLFGLIPGMLECQYVVDLIREHPKVYVTYSNPVSAAYAVQKLHNFEYPPGEKIFVKPDFSETYQRRAVRSEIPKAINNLKTAMNSVATATPDLKQLVDAIAQASSLIKTMTTGVEESDTKLDSTDFNYCSVPVPAPKPMAEIDSPVAKRCFLVCQPQPPPQSVLRDIFCRFGSLINVYTLPNKTVGYASYADANSASEAIRVLHGAEICGVRTKVLEAEDRPNINSYKRMKTE